MSCLEENKIHFIATHFPFNDDPNRSSGAKPRYVRVGSRDDTKGGAVYGVYKSVGHSKYKSYHGVDATYDYGVVILKKPLKLSRRVMIANLARDTLNEGTTLTLSGFGDGQFLMQSSVPIYDQEVCISNYGSIPLPLDPDVSFCAGFESGNVTSCFGDSGGPLVIGERTLYGIVSWGDDDCGLPHFPPVFARVSTMAEWFQAYIDEYV